MTAFLTATRLNSGKFRRGQPAWESNDKTLKKPVNTEKIQYLQGLQNGAAQRIRTADLFLTKEVLCLLS